MEGDSGFNDRVDKIFGSISKSKSKSSFWSITDAQIERRVWNKNKNDETTRDDDQTPLSSSFDHHHHEDDIRSSIGLDSTLDNEEEEDEFDKMAQGNENDDGRLYMKDVADAAAAADAIFKVDRHMLNATPPDVGIKSILKRKTHEMPPNPKSPKRVRFHPTTRNDHHQQPSSTCVLPVTQQSGGRTVPDYILNPSKYTRYDLHHHHVNNTDVYFGFLDQLNKSKHVSDDDSSSSAVLPKSVVFIPRKKQAAVCNSVKQQQSTGISIAASEVHQQDVAEISEMQQEQESHVCTKPTRQYRSKVEENDSLC